MIAMRPRIYADFNGLMQSPRDAARSMVPLDTWGSLCGLAASRTRLREGLKLVIHMDSDENQDIEADAVAYFDQEQRFWYAELESEIRDVPKHQSNSKLLCLGCRSELDRPSARNEVCPKCGEPVESAIAPPSGREED